MNSAGASYYGQNTYSGMQTTDQRKQIVKIYNPGTSYMQGLMYDPNRNQKLEEDLKLKESLEYEQRLKEHLYQFEER